jgi:ATP-dependent DNA ligase
VRSRLGYGPEAPAGTRRATGGTFIEVVGSFDDGQALWDVIVDRAMEGVVTKRAREPYRPGARLWVKTKDRTAARFQEELVGAQRRRRQRST